GLSQGRAPSQPRLKAVGREGRPRGTRGRLALQENASPPPRRHPHRTLPPIPRCPPSCRAPGTSPRAAPNIRPPPQAAPVRAPHPDALVPELRSATPDPLSESGGAEPPRVACRIGSARTRARGARRTEPRRVPQK